MPTLNTFWAFTLLPAAARHTLPWAVLPKPATRCKPSAWGKAQPEAEAQATALWGLFYGLTGAQMAGADVCLVDPGVGPIPLGRGADGVFEYAINLTMTCKKE